MPLDAGSRLGPYEILAPIGAGGMGEVYRARDTRLDRVVAVKVSAAHFGLAKLTRNREVGAATETIALTKEHTILGTLQYMSPEQLEAKEADARSDIFAFGAVLYEMVTGKRAFAGESQASVTAAIMDREPPTLSSVAPVAPRALERVVAKCLAKDPDKRWQSARDLKDELEWIASAGTPAAAAATPARRPWREYAAWLLAVILLGALAALYWRPRPTAEVTRFTIYPPEKTVFAGSLTVTVSAPLLALSPDGRALVFVASEAGADRCSGTGAWKKCPRARCLEPKTPRIRSGRPTAAGSPSSPTAGSRKPRPAEARFRQSPKPLGIPVAARGGRTIRSCMPSVTARLSAPRRRVEE
jgi:hypothetical protein